MKTNSDIRRFNSPFGFEVRECDSGFDMKIPRAVPFAADLKYLTACMGGVLLLLFILLSGNNQGEWTWLFAFAGFVWLIILRQGKVRSYEIILRSERLLFCENGWMQDISREEMNILRIREIIFRSGAERTDIRHSSPLSGSIRFLQSDKRSVWHLDLTPEQIEWLFEYLWDQIEFQKKRIWEKEKRTDSAPG